MGSIFFAHTFFKISYFVNFSLDPTTKRKRKWKPEIALHIPSINIAQAVLGIRISIAICYAYYNYMFLLKVIFPCFIYYEIKLIANIEKFLSSF